VQFLQDKIGQEYDGRISGVTEWGIFVEIIENHCEGMVRIKELGDDNYYFDEDNYCLRGRKYGRVLTLGDEVRIEVKRADLAKKQLDFGLVEILKDEPEQRRPSGRTGKTAAKKGKSGRESEAPKKPQATRNERFQKPEKPAEEKTSPKKSNSGKTFNEEWGFEI